MQKLKYSNYSFLFLLIFLNACLAKHHLSVAKMQVAQSIGVKSIVADSTLDINILKPYRAELDKTMHVPIGFTSEVLKKDKPNSTLGNMVCDAMLYKAKMIDNNVDCAVSNYGGLRINSINQGNILLEKIYELMPFENTIAIVPVKGEMLQTLCNLIAKAGGMPIAGMQFHIKQHLATNIIINNIPLDATKTYKVVLNSYMAMGGDDCDFLKPLQKNITNNLIRDAIIEYIKMKNQNKESLIQEPFKRIIYN